LKSLLLKIESIRPLMRDRYYIGLVGRR
jgi:hypothetical protein